MKIKVCLGILSLSLMNLHANEIQINDGYIQTSYGSIYYKKFYTTDNNDHTPLLVLHGGPGLTHDALDTLAELASKFPLFSMIKLELENRIIMIKTKSLGISISF